MASVFAGALPFISSSAPPGSSRQDITNAPPIPRELIGPAVDNLRDELLEMYWRGVRRELPYILLTLRRWQSREDMSGLLPDEEFNHVHGYDTFLDQVSHSSRGFFKRNAPTAEPPKKKDPKAPPTYEEALQDRGWDMFADLKSQRIKEAIRTSLVDREPLEPVRRRAQMLLQSAQFLDIDKIIEYREPETGLSFWKRPATAQMAVSSYDKLNLPIFVPQHCLECKAVIRGSMFYNIGNQAAVICETCYRATHYNQSTFSKKYKECCLPSAVTPEVGHKLCSCVSISRRDSDGRLRTLWPMDPQINGGDHLKGSGGRVSCGLYGITDLFAEAKSAATRLKLDKYNTLRQMKKKGLEEEEWDDYPMIGMMRPLRPKKLKLLDRQTVPEFGTSYGYTDESPEDIPLYLRSTTDKFPYGNVHMALRIGTIIIENGVANTHGGVLITSRDPPNLQVLRDPPEDINNCLLLTGGQDRLLYSQVRPRVPKRYKAFMKQVAGGPFCRFFNTNQEEDLIDALIQESDRLIDDGISFRQKEELLGQSTERLLAKLKRYLGSRVETYVSSIAAKLLDPELELRWNFRSNNCQMFCDRLIDRGLFGSLLDPQVAGMETAERPAPLYLMSFVCRPGAYVQTTTRSKYDVPNGLTEEYLLKFRYGRHDESDIIDTLAEYWYDWGGFEGPIYPYQDVFPWDCTEAYDRYPGKCGQCNISKHVWAFPFDSWSITSLHLTRGRQLYPRQAFPDTENAKTAHATGLMSDTDWFQNRLTILLGQDSLLTAAVALAKCAPFRESTLWLHQQDDQRMDRLKLGGIHRAQPFSHHFEKGAYHQYFIADWAHLTRPLRTAEYERLRDWKATREDVGKSSSNTNDGGRGGGCGGFSCGAVATGCAAAGVAIGHDTCGTGCASACGGGGGGGCGGGGGGCGGGGGGG